MVNAEVPETPPARDETIPPPYATEAFAETPPAAMSNRNGLPATYAPATACSMLLSEPRTFRAIV